MEVILNYMYATKSSKDLENYSLFQDELIRVFVAENPSCNLETIERLSQDPCYFVRKSLIKNSSVPLKVLEEMYEKEKVVKLKRELRDLIGNLVTENVMKYIKKEKRQWKEI